LLSALKLLEHPAIHLGKNEVSRKEHTSLKNIEIRVEGNKLVLEIDLTKEYGLTSSGKSITIAGTEGNVAVPGREEMKIGLNVYKPKNK
jgi:hypothetical protein